MHDPNTLKFFVKDKTENKKAEASYSDFSVTLAALRGNESEEMKALHYETIVKDLMTSLENTFYENEDSGADAFAKKTGFEDFSESLGQDWQHKAKPPVKDKDKFKAMSEEFY